MLMDEEYLLFNSDYLPKEVHDKNNISSLYELTDRQSVCSNQLEKLPTFTLNNTEIDAINTNFNQNSFLINDNYLSGKDSNKSSATLKFFEQFTDSDENDEDYLKGNYYQNGTKLSPTSIQNVKLLNEMLSHKMSLCSNKPRTKAITSCSSLLRHSVSMPNSRLLNQPNRHLKLALNSQRSPSYERKVEVKSEPQFSNMPKKVYLISNSPTSLSNTTTPNDDVFSVLEDHQYYARRAPVSPPPAKKRYFMPQFKSSSASTINSSVTSISNSNTMNHDFKSIKDNNNDSDYDFYVNNQSKYGTTIYSDNYRNKNRKAYSKLEKQKNNGMSILETFLRATCPLDPSKGSTAALMASEEMLNLSLEAETKKERTFRKCQSHSHTSYTNGNLLKKLLTGDIDSEGTSGIETCPSFASSPTPFTPSLSPTSQCSLSPKSFTSPVSRSPISHSPTPDSMENSCTLPVDSLLTDGFGLDADLTVDEQGGLHMQLDSEWQEDPFKMMSDIELREELAAPACEHKNFPLPASISDFL